VAERTCEGVSSHRQTNECQGGGVVHLEALVGRDGTVKEVKVLGGHPLPADALARAVKQWKYQAAKDSTELVRYSLGPEN